MPNHLVDETSPYLKQHAGNPVDWYPWGEEAFNRAKAGNKPILLSIGYSACHWCHVMERESFENEQIARIMNENFINIKVDREERPDVDRVYMDAVQTMTGAGGWPLTVFLTPEGKPFFGGTYFPPEDNKGNPGFVRVLLSVADAYRNNQGEVEQIVKETTAAVSRLEVKRRPGGMLTAGMLSRSYLSIMHNFDKKNGGFGSAPKFPHPLVLEFLLRHYYRTQDKTALDMVDLTLTKMAKGGIYDQLGGGFHRYAVDNRWLIPHFEKMLYDNALLTSVYLHAYLLTGRLLFRNIIEGTNDYVIREMRSPAGGFFSSQDADSEGEEGKYYLWTPEEVAEVVGPNNAVPVGTYFGVTPDGNYAGKNVLHIASELPLGMQGLAAQARAALRQRRNRRQKPGRDEKVLAGWNGLMLDALSQSAGALDRRDYLKVAAMNGEFLVNNLVPGGTLKHSWQEGVAKISGFLDDYALVIRGLLRLHIATFSRVWLETAIGLANAMVDKFWDESGGVFWDTADVPSGLFIRPREVFDEATPSGSSAATLVLLELARLTDNKRFEQIVVKSLEGIWETLLKYPMGMGNWLAVLDLYLTASKEIVLIGRKSDPVMEELAHVIYTQYLPDTVIAAHDPEEAAPASNLALFEGKRLVNDHPAVYICQNYVCQAPVTDPVSLRRQLKAEPPAPNGVKP